ncbi:MAG: hypothetical protein JJT89_04775 [Nitriliruptoraceae bacterium]|nr:hypothetical protein [Nitriliruptoraceae bacterium]
MRRWRTTSAVWAVVALVAVGCGRTGEATTRVDTAEEEIAGIVADMVDLLELEVTSETPLGTRTRCTQLTGANGLSNRLAVRGPTPAVDDPLGRATSVLSANDYVLSGTDAPDEVFGRRDGIRITVQLDRPTDQVAIDASTGCRPAPR